MYEDNTLLLKKQKEEAIISKREEAAEIISFGENLGENQVEPEADEQPQSKSLQPNQTFEKTTPDQPSIINELPRNELFHMPFEPIQNFVPPIEPDT